MSLRTHCRLPQRAVRYCLAASLRHRTHANAFRTVTHASRASDDSGSDSLLVVGAGAAGLTAAYFAAQQGMSVTVLERTREAGKKVLMSGGTRCNVLPVEVDLERDFFTDSSKSAMRAVFSSWSLWECKYWLESEQEGVGLELAEDEETAKYFPASNSSRDVRDALVAACSRLGVRFMYHASVEGMQQEDGRWTCQLADGRQLATDRLVVATGGLSFPAVGTDGTGHRILKGLGHSMKQLYPALTPLTGGHPGDENLAGLAQYSVHVTCQTGKKLKSAQAAQRTGFLFTHRGYSGPSVLDLSHHAVRALESRSPLPAIRVNWTGDTPEEWDELLLAAQASGALVPTVLKKAGLRERLADALCAQLGLQQRLARELKKTERGALVQLLTSYQLPYKGHEGYKKAEVTGGGVPLSEVDCASMESRVLPGVHLCGEVLDVFGRIGGFNFYWAWVSGRLAGLGAAKRAAAARHQEQEQQSVTR